MYEIGFEDDFGRKIFNDYEIVFVRMDEWNVMVEKRSYYIY